MNIKPKKKKKRFLSRAFTPATPQKNDIHVVEHNYVNVTITINELIF